MTTTAIRLPRVATHDDVVDTFQNFHEAVRDVATWAPTIIDDAGNANARDARWLRSFLQGPLAWHVADEEHVLVPWLALRRSNWLDAFLARSSERRVEIIEAAEHLAAVIEPLCAGNPIPVMRFRSAARRFEQTVEHALRFEDDILLPSARTFLDQSERKTIAKEIAASDATRPWVEVAVAGDAPVIHRVHAVRVRNAIGLDVIRSFADCPRGRATNIDACNGCPHLEDLSVGENGRGQIACALDDTPRRGERVGTIMTRDVVCVERDTPLSEAAELLSHSGVSGLPVVDEAGRAVGMLSQSDIVHAVADGKLTADRRVADLMMHAVFVVRESDIIDDAARLLVIEGIHRLPVINSDQAVVGIVSTLDLLKATVTPMRRLAAQPGLPSARGATSTGK